jgi:hypothetical protein
MPMKKFELRRSHDILGISGTGTVAEGVVLSDGQCVMRWIGELSSIVIHKSIENLEAVHCHSNSSRLVFLD